MPNYYNYISCEDEDINTAQAFYIVCLNSELQTYKLVASPQALNSLESDPETRARSYWPITREQIDSAPQDQIFNGGDTAKSICLDDDLVLWFTKSRPSLDHSKVISTKNASHYIWGNRCDGWWLHQSQTFTVISESMPPQTSENKHYHNYTAQFFYCLNGLLTLEIADQQYQLEPHSGITIPSRVAHTALNLSNERVDFLVISVPNAHLDRVSCN